MYVQSTAHTKSILMHTALRFRLIYSCLWKDRTIILIDARHWAAVWVAVWETDINQIKWSKQRWAASQRHLKSLHPLTATVNSHKRRQRVETRGWKTRLSPGSSSFTVNQSAKICRCSGNAAGYITSTNGSRERYVSGIIHWFTSCSKWFKYICLLTENINTSPSKKS